ncbi:MAG TPA: HNH endonuclease [Pyrinomonadaceae bacterium]|nr:HNH endonuclease [Pyrinomonadaceae bacterium]
MANEIIAYLEMCQREGLSLQRGMNFNVGGTHSVILMSLRPDAPYHDQVLDGGFTLIYEGHDSPRSQSSPNPKLADQPANRPSGTLTENGKFHKAAQDFKSGLRQPERVRVYEKIHRGIWSYNGIFHLVDSWQEQSSQRSVFKFKLIAVEGEEDFSIPAPMNPIRRRMIPTAVKLEVWKRDGGKCVMCNATDELHFDHILPYAKGGTSLTPNNVQLLCARHNLEKSDRIL